MKLILLLLTVTTINAQNPSMCKHNLEVIESSFQKLQILVENQGRQSTAKLHAMRILEYGIDARIECITSKYGGIEYRERYARVVLKAIKDHGN